MINSLEVLEELGLTKSEGRVYETLVEFGVLTAAEVSAKSAISYSKIYNVLDSLITKGLVSIIPEKTKKFSPSSPESFIKLIEEKERKIVEAKNKVKELKKFYEVKEKNPVIVAAGIRGFHKVVEEMKKTEKYCYNIKWNVETRPEWLRSRENKLKRKVEIKDMVRYNDETKKNIEEWLKISKSIKKIENEGIAFSVTDDEEVMIALIKSNMTILIKDKPFAKIMKKMFLETYKTAEEIK